LVEILACAGVYIMTTDSSNVLLRSYCFVRIRRTTTSLAPGWIAFAGRDQTANRRMNAEYRREVTGDFSDAGAFGAAVGARADQVPDIGQA
jgi:hypothetical protein